MKFQQRKTGNIYETVVDFNAKDEKELEHLTYDDIISLTDKLIKPMELCFFYQNYEGHIYFKYFDLTIQQPKKNLFIETARKRLKKVMREWQKHQQ